MAKEGRKPVLFPGKTLSKADHFRGAQEARSEGESIGGFDVTIDEVPEDVDSSYVPGYSELRKRQDMQKGAGKTPEALPARLQWAKAFKIDGAADHANINIRWKKKGYKPVTKEELEGFGWGSPPAAAYSDPAKGGDGYFYKEDSVLLVCDRERAIRNYEKVRQRTMEQAGTGVTSDAPWVKNESETERIIRLTDSETVFGGEGG